MSGNQTWASVTIAIADEEWRLAFRQGLLDVEAGQGAWTEFRDEGMIIAYEQGRALAAVARGVKMVVPVWDGQGGASGQRMDDFWDAVAKKAGIRITPPEIKDGRHKR